MKTKHYVLLFLFAFNVIGFVHGQTGIGTNLPDESAQLEVSSTEKGILIPRMSETQKTSIPNPAKGLLVFQNTGIEGFYYYDGTMWVLMGAQGPPVPGIPFEGFTANASLTNKGGLNNDMFSSWDVNPPFFSGNGFDPISGIYTVPATGKYHISVTLNYQLDDTSIGHSLPVGTFPVFILRRIHPVQTDLITGRLPVLNVSSQGIILRAILESGTVTLVGNVLLDAGEQIALFYDNNTMDDLFLFLGGDDIPVIWSVQQISE